MRPNPKLETQRCQCAHTQETDVAIKSLSGLDELRSALSRAPKEAKSNLTALGSWLASVADADRNAAAILSTLEREVRAWETICTHKCICHVSFCFSELLHGSGMVVGRLAHVCC